MSDFSSYPLDAAEREAAAARTVPGQAYAGWGSRFAAYLLDGIIVAAALFALFLVLAVLSSAAGEVSFPFGFFSVAGFVLSIAYFTVLHGGPRGQTLGKRAVGIRVVDEGGRSIGYGRAFGRYAIALLFGVVFMLAYLINYLWPLWDGRNQALHDKVVGSFVVPA